MKAYRDWSVFSKVYLVVCLVLVVVLGLSNVLDDLLSGGILKEDVSRRSLEAAQTVANILDLAKPGSDWDEVHPRMT